MTEPSFVKIEVSNGKAFYLLSEQKNGGEEGFSLSLSDGDKIWDGFLSEDNLDNLAKKMKMDFNSYVQQTAKAFTRDELGDLTFEYQVKGHGADAIQLIWKKYVPTDDIRFQMGSVNLHEKANSCKFICKIFTNCIENIGRLKNRIRSLETDNERLSQERSMALKRLDKCVSAKEENERDLYGKFVAVLNSKKEKIRNLKRNAVGDEVRPADLNVEDEADPVVSPKRSKRDQVDNDDNQSSGNESNNTDEETTPKKRYRKATNLSKKPSLDSSLVLGDEMEVTKVVTRPARQNAAKKKQTPSKPVLPKVSSKTSDSSGSSVRKSSLRKSSSNTSNRSSENIEPEDLFGDL